MHRLKRATVALCLALTLFLPPFPPDSVTEVAALDVTPLAGVRDADDRWGLNHVDGSASSQKLALDTGSRWNRWEFRWGDIEQTRGRFDWARADAMITASQNSGLRVQGILISMPEWAIDPQTKLPSGLNLAWNDQRNLWARFVREAATRYGGRIRYWEVWNEADHAEGFWAGTTADYYQMLKVSYQAIRSVDRTAQVAIGGLAYWPNPTFLDDLLRLMVADQNARADNYYFDILPWHTYSRPSDVWDRVTESRRKLQATVGSKPIWINETHVPAWDESPIQNFRPYSWAATTTEQASYVVQAAAYAIAAGVDKFFIYRFQDTEWPEAYGLLRDVGTIRPTYVAYQVVTRHLSNATSGALARQGDTEQIVIQKPGQRVIVAWNRVPTAQTVLLGAASTSGTVVDQTGATRQVRTTGGQYQLNLPGATANNGVDANDYLIGGSPLIVTETLRADLRTVEESSPLIGYAGAWETVSTTGPSGGAVRRTGSPGLGAAVEFEGPTITWVTSKGPDRGVVRVDVDGAPQGTIDLYSPTTVWNVPLTFGDFSQGSHRMVLTVIGQRNPASIGSFVDVDQFAASSLRAALPPPTPSPTPSPTNTPTPTRTLVPTATPTSTPAPFVTLTPIRPQAASYTGVDTPSSRVFLPIVMRNWFGWTSPIFLQNTGSLGANASVTFLDENGGTAGRFTAQLPPGGSQTLDPRTVAGLADGFTGSAVVDSAQPVAASVTETRDGLNALAYSGVSTGAERVFAPLLFKDYNGWDTSIQVQNLQDQPVPVTVTFQQANAEVGEGATWQQTAVVAGRSSTSLSQALNTNLPAGFVGLALVEAPVGSSIAALVSESHQSGNASSYDGALAGSTVVNAPLLFKNANGWSTGIQVQNVGAAPTEVQVRYLGVEGQGTWSESASLAAGASTTFYQPANPDLPDGFVGAAVVTSVDGQPLVAIVNQVNPERNIAMTYRGFGAGTSPVAVPRLAKNAEGWNTGVQVQNLGTDSAQVTLELRAEDGAMTGSVVDTVPAGASVTFYLPTVNILPEGWRGSGIVTSSPTQPLGAIVNQTRY